jgi:hypothetical protein
VRCRELVRKDVAKLGEDLDFVSWWRDMVRGVDPSGCSA